MDSIENEKKVLEWRGLKFEWDEKICSFIHAKSGFTVGRNEWGRYEIECPYSGSLQRERHSATETLDGFMKELSHLNSFIADLGLEPKE